MEQNSNNGGLTEDELRNAGASARREVDSGPFTLEELNDNPDLGGHFFAALWRGDEEGAAMRADGSNLPIIEEVLGKQKAEILGW